MAPKVFACNWNSGGREGNRRPQAVRQQCSEKDCRDRRLPEERGSLRVAAEFSKLRLADIAFDSKTLRVIAEAEGAINVYVSARPAL
jgi:hypothetical protein